LFKPASMKKLSIIVLDRDVRAVTRVMGRLGVVHLASATDADGLAGSVDLSVNEKQLDQIRTRIASLKRLLDIDSGQDKCKSDETMLAPLLAERELDVMERQVDKVNTELAAAREEKEELASTARELEGLEGLDVPVEQIPQLSFLHFALGEATERQIQQIRHTVGKKALVFSYDAEGGRRRFVAVTGKKGRFALSTAIEKAEAVTENISERHKGVAAEILDRARERLRDLGEVEERDQATLRGLREKYGPRLAVLDYWTAVEESVLSAEEGFARTSKTWIISGWVPEVKIPALVRRLMDATQDRMVARIAEPGAEEPPVLLEHHPWLQPFAGLVSTYSTPSYREIEPTLFVAIAFLLLFGLMFGDVGHGVVLLALGLALLWRGVSGTLAQGARLLVMAGASAILFGFMFGSLFGYEGVIEPLWFTPAEPDNMMTFLVYMVLLGVGIISLGVILSIINRLAVKDYFHAFLDKTGVVGGAFYWGAVALAARAALRGTAGMKAWHFALLIVAPLAILFFRQPIYALLTRRKKLYPEGALSGVMESAVEVMETLSSFLANTVSFVRVGAFALAHAMLMMAVNSLAAVAAGGAVATVGSVLILIVGNALAIALEGLVVAIQVLRLQYYEFFGKFFVGGGERYEPFTTP